jgi:hypothetical protein
MTAASVTAWVHTLLTVTFATTGVIILPFRMQQQRVSLQQQY